MVLPGLSKKNADDQQANREMWGKTDLLSGAGQMAELRLPDLCFSRDEVALFLNEGMGLAHDDLTALQARAESWAAGLRLLAGFLNRAASAADHSAFLQNRVVASAHRTGCSPYSYGGGGDVSAQIT